MKILKNALCGALFILLAGCGFHLQGLESLSPEVKNLYVDTSTPNSTLMQDLYHLLSAQQVKLASSAQNASAILKIISVNQQQAPIAITGGSLATENLYTYTVTFTVMTSAGKTLLKPTTVTSTRTYNTNASQVLSANTQVQQLSQSMERELSLDIVSALSTITLSTGS